MSGGLTSNDTKNLNNSYKYALTHADYVVKLNFYIMRPGKGYGLFYSLEAHIAVMNEITK